MTKKYRRLKLACYATNVSMAIVSNFPPLLFLTFRSLYGISYTLLGLLVLINFCTQLAVDLIFSFFSHKFNIPLSTKLIPVLTFSGIAIYALCPFVLSGSMVYLGLVLGTVIFSASGGLTEVLISPIIAAIPAEDPDREMSKLHSIYAWGVVFLVVISTVFFYFVGGEKWQWLALILSIVPICASILYAGVDIPEMKTPEKTSGAIGMLKNGGIWLCVLAIFLGGAAECTMAQWCSSYLEAALGISKVWGDLFGVALFGLSLGLGRTLYSRVGKNIERILLFGAIGATLCYLIAALTDVAVLGLFACAFTGFCVSMLWPGSLIVASDRFPSGGVFIFALMASGGDFGASVGPQLVGVVTDAVLESSWGIELASKLSLSVEQVGMKLGMLVGMLFPLIAVLVYFIIWKQSKKKQKT